MKEYYFTFGYGHNPGIGYYTTICAEDEGKARHEMSEHYGLRWSFCYLSAEAAGVERFMLKRVEPGFKFPACEICGEITESTGTLRCDRCWELETRIERDPKLAKKILANIKREESND